MQLRVSGYFVNYCRLCKKRSEWVVQNFIFWGVAESPFCRYSAASGVSRTTISYAPRAKRWSPISSRHVTYKWVSLPSYSESRWCTNHCILYIALQLHKEVSNATIDLPKASGQNALALANIITFDCELESKCPEAKELVNLLSSPHIEVSFCTLLALILIDIIFAVYIDIVWYQVFYEI